MTTAHRNHDARTQALSLPCNAGRGAGAHEGMHDHVRTRMQTNLGTAHSCDHARHHHGGRTLGPMQPTRTWNCTGAHDSECTVICTDGTICWGWSCTGRANEAGPACTLCWGWGWGCCRPPCVSCTRFSFSAMAIKYASLVLDLESSRKPLIGDAAGRGHHVKTRHRHYVRPKEIEGSALLIDCDFECAARTCTGQIGRTVHFLVLRATQAANGVGATRNSSGRFEWALH